MAGKSGFRYAILGAGRQGTAAAHDLGRFGGAARVILADARGDAARQAAQRVSDLLSRALAEPAALDASDAASLRSVVAGARAMRSLWPHPRPRPGAPADRKDHR